MSRVSQYCLYHSCHLPFVSYREENHQLFRDFFGAKRKFTFALKYTNN